MDANALAFQLQGAFGDRIVLTPRSPKRLYVGVPPAGLVEVFDYLRAHVPGLRLATSTAIDLRDGIGVWHHLAINGRPLVVTLKTMAPKPEPTVPSLATRVAAADWIEREMHDLTGVRFEGHPDLRRLVKAKAFSETFPLRRDFEPSAFKESIGERPEF